MEKILEDYLWGEIPDVIQALEQGLNGTRKGAQSTIDEMYKMGWIKNRKQGLRTLQKWNDKGLINWGSNILFCWRESCQKQ